MGIKRLNKTFLIAVTCVMSYCTVYVARNVLGAVTPVLLSLGYSEEYVGQISSLFLVFYACGQLVNGFIGDRIKAKYMMTAGLLFAGISNVVFPFVIDSLFSAIIVYGISGYFLSMIYGPMTKFVSENLEQKQAVRVSVAYGFSSYVGSPVAGLLASFLIWNDTFTVSGVALIVMAVTTMSILLNLERNHGAVYNVGKKKIERQNGGIKALFKRGIVRFSLVAILTGIVRTSVVFWLPTYINQRLGFSPEDSALLFTVATAVIAPTAFIVAVIFEKNKRDMRKTMITCFTASTVFFVLAFFFSNPVINLICMILAIMGNNGSATILWSMYCPSLYDTGMVSTATGFLDFLSYMSAALANVIFATASITIGWANLVLVWSAIMTIGIVVSIKKFQNVEA